MEAMNLIMDACEAIHHHVIHHQKEEGRNQVSCLQDVDLQCNEQVFHHPMQELEQELMENELDEWLVTPHQDDAKKVEDECVDDTMETVLQQFLHDNPNYFWCQHCGVIWDLFKITALQCPSCHCSTKTSYLQAHCEKEEHIVDLNMMVKGATTCPAFACNCKLVASKIKIVEREAMHASNSTEELDSTTTIVKDEGDDAQNTKELNDAEASPEHLRVETNKEAIAESKEQTEVETPTRKRKRVNYSEENTEEPPKKKQRSKDIVKEASPKLKLEGTIGTCDKCLLQFDTTRLFDPICPKCHPKTKKLLTNKTDAIMGAVASCENPNHDHEVCVHSLRRTNNLGRRCPVDGCLALLRYHCTKCKANMTYQSFTRTSHHCYAKHLSQMKNIKK